MRCGEREIHPAWLSPKRPTRFGIDLRQPREEAHLRLRVMREQVDGAGRASPGNVPRDSPDAALVVGEDGEAVQLEIRGEDLELVARARARAVHHHDRRERAGAGRQPERCRVDADAHLTLPEGEPRVVRSVPRESRRVR